jgi:hypothetical protein
MLLSRTIAIAAFAGLVAAGFAAPQSLLHEAAPSPDKSLAANVEWDPAGFIGVMRMRIFGPDGKLRRTAEIPEINPSPANLVWLDNEWVACDSFIGDRGSGFFYVHAPTGRGYLLEVSVPKPGADWVVNISSTDPASSASVPMVSRGRSSLFPVLLRTLPDDAPGYFTTEFRQKLTDAVDAFLAWRRDKGFRSLDLISDTDIRPELGALVLARLDDRTEVIYFPAGAESPADMLARARRVPLPDELHRASKADGAPELRVRWGEGAAFAVETVPLDPKTAGNPKLVAQGKLEGVSDKPVPPDPPSGIGSKNPITVKDAKMPEVSDGDEKAESGRDEEEPTTQTIRASPTPGIVPGIYPAKPVATKKPVPMIYPSKASPTKKPASPAKKSAGKTSRKRPSASR